LLHKHPDRVQHFEVSGGVAYVFYPESTAARCTVALLVDIDPIALIRGRSGVSSDFALGHYVNDRPYAASSLVAVALGKVFRTALSGRCTTHPDLAKQALPLEIRVPVVPMSGGAEQVRALFKPLGWDVIAAEIPLDVTVPEWGNSRYVDLQLSGTMPLSVALSHLYVLLPVLDGVKHYWVDEQEVDKLIRAASEWLPDHPQRQEIARRYLARQKDLTESAMERLIGDGESPAVEGPEVDQAPRTPVARPRLGAERVATVVESLRVEQAARVVDIGCGEGALLRELIKHAEFTEIVGVDVSPRALERAERSMHFDRMPDQQRSRLTLRQSSLSYVDQRLAGYDALVLMEVIEHLDPARLPSLANVVFGAAKPATVVMTTPNADYNLLYEGLAPGAFRHRDHRFEWTREEFASWASEVCRRFGYTVRMAGIGPDDPALGAPTQMAVFTRSHRIQEEAS
ncbi:MAG: 3' terminal RNA ribose 2'-O-methyltransferase Hen1, partial [Ornithinimicrobium sp.]